MYRRIVVALDGSELAERVLPHVEMLADRFGAQLILLRATPVAGVSTDALDAERREADRYLTAISTRLSGPGGAAPVVLLTAASDHIVQAAVTACGAVGYIPKPFELEHVIETLARHLPARD